MDIKGKYTKMANTLSNPREFFTLVGSIVIATIGVLAWANTSFVSTAKGVEMMDEAKEADSVLTERIVVLTQEVQQSNQMLSIHLKQGELDSVLDRIRENDTQQFNIGQFVRVNGSDDQSTKRLRDLENEMKDLELKKTCIITNNPLCD